VVREKPKVVDNGDGSINGFRNRVCVLFVDRIFWNTWQELVEKIGDLEEAAIVVAAGRQLCLVFPEEEGDVLVA
jgi:hypothetical protein